MKIDTKHFVAQLAAVRAGLSNTEIVEQSTSFVFKDGRVITYNDEISCSCKTDFKEEAAIPANEFYNLLTKIPDEKVDITVEKGEVLIKGKKKKGGIRIEEEVNLPYDNVEDAGKWKKLDEKWLEGLGRVWPCASTNEAVFALTCVVVKPDQLQTTDRIQAARYKIKTPIKKTILLRGTTVPYIIDFHPLEIATSKGWTHFKNKEGVVLSCRWYEDEYPEVDQFFEDKGEKITLPNDLLTVCQRTEIFSKNHSRANELRISLGEGEIKVLGQGETGWFEERSKSKYKGPSLEFSISPSTLVDVVKRNPKCLISKNTLLSTDEEFSYVTALKKD